MSTTEAKAVARFISHAPRKVRLVIDQVRGLQVDQALAILKFMPKAAAEPVSKAIESATANAEENLGLVRSDLFIKEIRADEGPRRRGYRFGARGRFKPIRRRSSHIIVIVHER
jgi:large subunit ribosomal protein L22